MSKYILVVGGELFNKGAQAMTFTTVNEIAKRFPDKEVVLLSNMDARRPVIEKNNYKFHIINMPSYKEMVMLSHKFIELLFKRKYAGTQYDGLCHYFSNAAALIDISGYALGSNWGVNKCERYLWNIYVSKHNGISVYLFPQSFGPFDFKGKQAFLMNTLIKHFLKYPKVIMAREKDGYELLTQKYGLNNVVKTPDLVLQERELELHHIYKMVPDSFRYEVKPNSVALIPNRKNNKYGNETELYALYQAIVSEVLTSNRNVYLVYHAVEDLNICNEIKSKYYEDDDRVVVLDKELSCIDFSAIVHKFDYIIASRYHSIVHAYKENVPAIILGWAVKYQELSGALEQEKYCFDVRKQLDTLAVIEIVKKMNANYKAESEIIKRHMAEIQKGSVYDYLEISE